MSKGRDIGGLPPFAGTPPNMRSSLLGDRFLDFPFFVVAPLS